jgi:uracil-DNA glycosylase
MKMEESWRRVLEDEMNLPYFKELERFVEGERLLGTHIYPPDSFVYQAFFHTPFDKVKVVIVGQDPYHGKGHP